MTSEEEARMKRDLQWLLDELLRLLEQKAKTKVEVVVDNGRIKGFHANRYVENPLGKR